MKKKERKEKDVLQVKQPKLYQFPKKFHEKVQKQPPRVVL